VLAVERPIQPELEFLRRLRARWNVKRRNRRDGGKQPKDLCCALHDFLL
jgi:hypothetical protein